MDWKRILAASAVGVLSGVFCVAGTISMKDQFSFEVTNGVLASTFYNRFLIGFVVGIADRIGLKPYLRGPLLGALVGLGLAAYPLFDSDIGGAVVLLTFSAAYGLLADIIASRFSQTSI